MRKYLGLALAAILALTPVSAVAFDYPTPDSQRQFQGFDPFQFVPMDPAKPGQYLTYGVFGGGDVNPGTSFLANKTDSKFCDSLDSKCFGNGDVLMMKGFATFCEQQSNSVCIAKLEFKNKEGDWETAQFSDYWDSTPSQENIDWLMESRKTDTYLPTVLDISKTKSWKQKDSWNTPGSAPGPATFVSSSVSNAGGTNKYLVDASFRFTAGDFKNGKPGFGIFNTFHVDIRPFMETNPATARNSLEFFGLNYDNQKMQGGTGPSGGFGTWQVNNRIGYSVAFADNTQVRLTMKIPKALGGWFHTRMSAPDLSLKTISESTNQVVISGGTSQVSTAAGWIDRFSPEALKYKDYFGGQKDYDRAKALLSKNIGGTSGTGWTAGTPISEYQKFAPLLGDKARGKASLWYLDMMPPERLGNNQCLNKTDRVQGLINTNAMVYQADVPKFTNGFLQYEVAGLHYNMDGNVEIGKYDLIIRSDTARCLYGWGKAPLSATVSVVNDKGTKTTATTTVSEKDGWLKLAAYGFTFSKKTIKVKITKKKK